MKYGFKTKRVVLVSGLKSLKEARSAIYYIRRYKTKPKWKNIGIARRAGKYVIVGQKR